MRWAFKALRTLPGTEHLVTKWQEEKRWWWCFLECEQRGTVLAISLGASLHTWGTLYHAGHIVNGQSLITNE